ncbi:MAG: GntR family transcriptional regulator [Alphaproteobacteria bacterium]|nr:GntR family transcriptional regulator [Alphaproteobacteria bacterium]
MESIDTELAARIRSDIINGTYGEGKRLSEAQLCQAHNVSRTPVRMALRQVEREGLVRRAEGRGYFVNSPTVADIMQAVQVRGHLESLAARLMAQSPGRENVLPDLESAIDEIDRLINLGDMSDTSLRLLQRQNAVFHKTILEGCGNEFVSFTCNRISHLPMLKAGSMVFDTQVLSTKEGIERSLFRLRIGNSQHKVIFEAIQRGDAVRAEGMMREHSNTMVEYIEVFEKRNEKLTVPDLISYSGIQLSDPETGPISDNNRTS